MKTAFELIEEHGLTLHGDIEHFAELVRADEREACAMVCEDLPAPERMSLDSESFYECVTLDCADAIRARSNT